MAICLFFEQIFKQIVCQIPGCPHENDLIYN